ncbi:MAG: hypothetical protein UR69_C0002G0234 [Candidatus Moranbacteria bacterium GW2011_GWE2_35_2-]|nr:MAG: hypothetical protein UR69_C0002G0234 [Candidatus Moranbacteria bacterium GW2011_GWE2_35_2-]KKQ22418.1 MAG: hypothetical protein US37_C0002G0043 [Candidatus Moranbacteria bacterium GW2011_GWF2_37_11]KKQ29487.1 MAG: hypothetical protein US44_C0001G0079 [Candidatus Moranbacteria bacterium GW2011_GWD1_37_17]KKQ30644.1 MAG: hypothetical protein US47_C0002G0234 [Candidatus Moranbacteria bacterium GW2011_GWE1_37_24]KKQ47746.1 MAG: hypothetical protein US66_C0006G0005 [Candidatus Moranbacteria 
MFIKIFKPTKIKFIIALIIAVLVFVIFDKFLYGSNCTLKLACVVGDLDCEKKIYYSKNICPLIPYIDSLVAFCLILFFPVKNFNKQK